MDDLRLGQPVEVRSAKPDPDNPDIPVPGDWKPGRIVGLYYTSVHLVLDDDPRVPPVPLAFSAADRDRAWRAVGRTYVIPKPGETS